jgi:hypothetical protein
MERTEIINRLIAKHNYKNYLEIGVQYGHNFRDINLPRECKTSVDIKKQVLDFDYVLDYETTSDNFFKQNTKKYDMIFIDGDHSFEQSYLDVTNALECLNFEGTIVCHDCYPTTEELASSSFMGTVYKTILKLQMTKLDLNIFVVNTDCGCGVIQRCASRDRAFVEYDESLYAYKNFIARAKECLNLKEPNEFISMLN